MVVEVTGIMKFNDMSDGYVVVYDDGTRSGWRRLNDWNLRKFNPEYRTSNKNTYGCSKFLPIELVKR